MRTAFLVPAMLLALTACEPGPGPGNGNGDGTECEGWPATAVQFEDEVLQIVNARRATGGNCGSEPFPASGALIMDPQLRCAARLHSKDMGERGFFAHENPDGENVADRVARAGFTGWTMLGENIASGMTDAESVMSIWMLSAGHCSNILKTGYTHIGVGYAYVDGSPAPPYWTQNFARKQ